MQMTCSSASNKQTTCSNNTYLDKFCGLVKRVEYHGSEIDTQQVQVQEYFVLAPEDPTNADFTKE